MINNTKDFFKKKESLYSVIFAGLVVIIITLNSEYYALYDLSYYIGVSSSSVYSNTLQGVSPYTGLSPNMEDFFQYYLLNTDELQSAVICQIFHITSTAERFWSYSLALSVIFEIGVFLCISELIKNDRSYIFFFISNLILFFSSVGVSDYFAIRPYEGKAIISYLYPLFVLLFSIKLYNGDMYYIMGLALCSLSCVAFSNSALFIIPSMEFFYLIIPYFMMLKNSKKIIYTLQYATPMIICLCWIILYKVL